MSSLEAEIIEKFHQLTPDAQQRVRAVIESEMPTAAKPNFDYDAWSKRVQALREQIQADHGNHQLGIDVVQILRDIRDGENDLERNPH